MITNAREQSVLLALLADLDAAGAFPILLRNHAGFPYEIGNDLDIWVRPSTRRTARATFCRTMTRHGFRLVHEHERYAFDALWVAHETESSRILHVDIYGGALRWHGHPFLCEAEFERLAIMRDGVRIPSPLHEAWTLAATSLAWGGFFKERYCAHIGQLAKGSDLALMASRALGGMSDELSRRLDGRADKAVDRRLAYRIRVGARSRHLLRDPIGAALAFACHWWWEFRCLFLVPPGLIVGVADLAHAERLQSRIESMLAVFGGITIFRRAWTPASWLWARKRAGDNHLVIVVGSARLGIKYRFSDAEIDETNNKELSDIFERCLLRGARRWSAS